MFSGFASKLGEFEQEIQRNLAQAVNREQPDASVDSQPMRNSVSSSTSSKPADSRTPVEAPVTIEGLQRQLERYKEKLANGMREFKKVAEDNDKLKLEIKNVRATSNAPKPLAVAGASGEPTLDEWNVLKAKYDSVEKELSQVRLNAKLQIKRLQKQLDQTENTLPPSDAGLLVTTGSQSSTEDLQSEDSKRVAQLEQELTVCKNTIKSLETQVADKSAELKTSNSPHKESAAGSTDKDANNKLSEIGSLVSDLWSGFQLVTPDNISDDINESDGQLRFMVDYFNKCLESQVPFMQKSDGGSVSAPPLKPEAEDRDSLKQRIVALESQLNIALSKQPASSVALVSFATQSVVSEPHKQNTESMTLEAVTTESELRDIMNAMTVQLESRTKDLDGIKFRLQTAEQERAALKHQLDVQTAKAASLEDALASSKQHGSLSSTNIAAAELEERNFSLEEQLKDFRVQVASRQAELHRTQEELSHTSSELESLKKMHDERIRKMKGILVAANKSVTELKKTLAERDSEIEDIRGRLQSSSLAEQEAQLRAEHLEIMIHRTNAEKQDEKDSQELEIERLQKQLFQAKEEAKSILAEFQGYKIRAAAALQKTGSSASEKRITELEQMRIALEKAAILREEELHKLNSRNKVIENELALAVEQVSMMESSIKRSERAEQDVQSLKLDLELITSKLEFERRIHEEALASRELSYNTKIEQLKTATSRTIAELESKLDVKKSSVKQANSDEGERTIEKLKEEVSNLKKQLLQSQDEIKRLATETPKASLDASRPNVPPPIYTRASSASLSDVDVSRSARPSISLVNHPNSLSSYKEKEYQLQIVQLQDMLNDNEAELERLHNQEKLLKDELRKVDRMEKREKSMSIEYLKNVVISFIESEEKESLVPVISQVLHLSPDEAKRIIKKVRPDDNKLLPTFSFV